MKRNETVRYMHMTTFNTQSQNPIHSEAYSHTFTDTHGTGSQQQHRVQLNHILNEASPLRGGLRKGRGVNGTLQGAGKGTMNALPRPPLAPALLWS